jgi:DNA replication regulator SLD3
MDTLPIRFVTFAQKSSCLCELIVNLSSSTILTNNSFSARLPDQVKAISRKLGGPLVVSPSRPKLAKSTSSSATLARPGAMAKRPVPSKSQRSLQRVLTNERQKRSGSYGPSGAISLMRSATAPVVPGLKTEASETPLASIPTAELPSITVSRGGVLKSKKFSQREVDLSNLINASDTNPKKASIEAELKEAIAALKKPNRQLAGQLMVETAEKRAASGSTVSRSRSSFVHRKKLILMILRVEKPDSESTRSKCTNFVNS